MFRSRKTPNRENAQGIIEFALVLPIVLMIIFGIIELGYLLFSYSSVNTASKDAARYGIAIGDGTGTSQRYWDCTGIVEAGLRLGSFVGLETSDFQITYDSGPGTATDYSSCADLASYGGTGDGISFGDRIVVTVTHDYQPIAALMGINIPPFNMTSTSHRTIVKNANISNNSDPGGGGGGGGGGSPTCHTLVRTKTGYGDKPVPDPTNSVGCPVDGYLAGEPIILRASPDFGYSVGSWVNTNNDTSLGTINTVTMPDGDLTVGVNYLSTSPVCFALALIPAGTGTGSVPTPTPANSPWCPGGTFVEDEIVSLSASADAGSHIEGWVNTLDDASTSSTNTVIMPGAPLSVNVIYEVDATCYALTTDHTGLGVDPSVTAPNCTGGLYIDGTVVTLNAFAGIGYEVGSWIGSDNPTWTSPTNYVIMDADKTVTVNYVPSSPLDPPSSVNIPNGPGDWTWQNGLAQCQDIDLRWSINGSWAEAPAQYEVFNGGVSYGFETDTHWDIDFTIDLGDQITLGVRAIFPGGYTSLTQNVTYECQDSVLASISSTVE